MTPTKRRRGHPGSPGLLRGKGSSVGPVARGISAAPEAPVRGGPSAESRGAALWSALLCCGPPSASALCSSPVRPRGAGGGVPRFCDPSAAGRRWKGRGGATLLGVAWGCPASYASEAGSGRGAARLDGKWLASCAGAGAGPRSVRAGEGPSRLRRRGARSG